MDQTPIHDQHNPELLALMPPHASRIIEAGCSSGALAREYKKLNPTCSYVGIEIEPAYAERARRYCDIVHELDIEAASDQQLDEAFVGDCWVFGDTLEHLRDPWRLLQRIRIRLPAHGSVVACIPNVQHWSVQARLVSGQFRYEPMGLLDRTHLRFFTRETIGELFSGAQFAIESGYARNVGPMPDASVQAAIRQMAQSVGADPEAALRDAMAFQYVLRAVPR